MMLMCWILVDFLYIIHHYPMGNVLDQPVILDTLPEVVVLDLVGLAGHVVRLGCRRGTAATRRGAISTQSVQNL